jgi:hypothetical protein
MTSTLSCVTVSGVESVYVDSIRSGPARVRQVAIWSSDRSRKVAGCSLSDCRFAPVEQTSRLPTARGSRSALTAMVSVLRDALLLVVSNCVDT